MTGDHFPYYLVDRASLDAFMASPRYARGKLLAAGHARKKAAAEAANPTPPKRVRNRSINQELTMLWTMLNKAVEWGLIDDNPVATSKGLQLPEHDSRPFRALTEKEFDTFRRDCPDDLLPPLLAAALLGLREEEVRQLEWTDIDLNARMLRLSQKSNLRLKSQGWTGVKQFEFRIPASLHAELMQLFLKRQAFKDNFVFHNTEGRKYPKGALRKRLCTVLARCGITDVTQLHALRKTFITHLARREKNLFLVQELARHKDLRTTRRYVNVFAEDKNRALDDFEIGSGPPPRPAPAPAAIAPRFNPLGEAAAG